MNTVNILVHDFTTTCSLLVHYMFMSMLQHLLFYNFLNANCSQLIYDFTHDLFLVHDLFMPCSLLVHNLFMTCSWLVHEFCMICFWPVHWYLTIFCFEGSPYSDYPVCWDNHDRVVCKQSDYHVLWWPAQVTKHLSYQQHQLRTNNQQNKFN